ncbi:YqjF family protein, partial [Natronolimnohabitans innermongolicus]
MGLPIAMGWRHLLFANWPVDPDVVAARLPDDLSVETYDGRAWLSVVPYLNVDVRPRGLPGGLGFELPELNLRTYVSRDGEPGIYFFSLDAEGILGVVGARLFHRLPYYYADIAMTETERGIAFSSERRQPGAPPAEFVGTYDPIGEPFVPAPDSLAAFLTERYRYYTTARDGTLRYADIDHDPWSLREVTVTIDRNTLFEANGFES